MRSSSIPRNGEGSAIDSPIVSISHAANPLTLLNFAEKQRPYPALAGPRPRLRPIPSVGRASDPTPRCRRLWSSDEARAKDSPGVLAGADGWRPPARRGLPERIDPPPCVKFAPRPDQQWTGRRSGKVRTGPPSESPWKTTARSGLLRRNGNNTTAPGEARPLRALPNRLSASGEEPCLARKLRQMRHLCSLSRDGGPPILPG